MSTITPTELGRQLMKPDGENGLKVAESMSVTNEKLYDFVLNHFEISDGDKILEIGFGNGKTIPKLFAINKNINYFGVDFSELMCREALLNNPELRTSIQISCQNAMSMNFKNDFFDSIITLNTVYFWENIEKQIAELKRVLRKGGILVIGYRPKSSMEKLPFTAEVFTLFEAKELRSIFVKNGFKIKNEISNPTVVKSVDGSIIEMLDSCLVLEKI